MKKLVIKSISVGFPLVALLACSSENLQTTGLGPSNTVTPNQPGNTNNMTPGSTPDPMMMSPGTSNNPPPTSNEGNPPVTAPPVTNNNPPPAGNMDDMDMETDDEMDETMEPVEPPPLTPAEVGGALDGFMHQAPCNSADFGHDCTLPGCMGGQKITETPLQLGGDPDTIYDVTVHVYGVVEPRRYDGGVRRAGANFDPNGLDFWHAGGTVPGGSTYNSYELHVNPRVEGAPNDYFLNSRTGGDQTFVIRLDYEATFPVQGGGTVQFRSTDSNCRQITNCATQECGPVGPKPVVLASVMNADPAPAGFMQPYQTGANIGRGQWVYIDVTNVVARP
jgi:hypothetical protein